MLRVVLYFLSAICMTGIAVSLVLHTQPVRNAVKQFITQTIEKNINARCQIKEIKGNLLTGLEIDGFSLTDLKHGKPLIAAKRLNAAYSLPMLFFKEVWVNRLVMDGVAVHLVQAEGGTWNMDSLFSSKAADKFSKTTTREPVKDFKIAIQILQIQNSTVEITQVSDIETTRRSITAINCQAGIDIGSEISLDLHHLSFDLDQPQTGLADASGLVRFDPDKKRLYLKEFNINSRHSSLVVNGEALFTDDSSTVDLAADIKALSLAEIGRAASVAFANNPIFSGTITANGPMTALNYRATLQSGESRAQSEGVVHITEQNGFGCDVSAGIYHFNPMDFSTNGKTLPQGNLNVDFTLNGQKLTLPDQTGHMEILLKSSLLSENKLDSGELSISLNGPDLSVNTLTLNTPYGALACSGTMDGITSGEMDNQIEFSADLKQADPGIFFQNSDYSGNINAMVHAAIMIPKTFVYKESTGQIFLTAGASNVKGVKISTGEINAVFRDQQIILKQCDVKTNVGRASLSGRGSFDTRTCMLKGAATITDLSLLQPFIPDLKKDAGLGGSLSITGEINGKWDEPEIEATLTAKHLAFQDAVLDSLTTTASFCGNAEKFVASGKCLGEGLRAEKIQIPSLNIATSMTEDSAHVDMKLLGRNGEHLELSGDVAHWLKTVKEITVSHLALTSDKQPPLVNNGPIKVSVSKNRLIVEPLKLDSGDASLELRGNIGSSPSMDLSAFCALQNFDLNRVSGFWERGKQLHGRFSADARLSGSCKSPNLKASMSLKDFGYKSLLFSDVSAGLSYENAKATIDLSCYQSSKKIISAKGYLKGMASLYPFEFKPMPGGLELTLNVDDLDVSEISALIRDPEYDVGGILRVDAHVTGDMEHPVLKGRVGLKGGNLFLKKQGLTYEKMTADMSFGPETIDVSSLQISGDREGSMHLSGSVTYDGFTLKAYDLRALGENFYIPFHTGVDVRIKPNLVFTGPAKAPKLSGSIVISEGRVNLEKFYQKQASEIKVVKPVSAVNGVFEIPDEEPESLSFIAPITANVMMEIPNNVWLKGKNENIEIKGKVALKKEPGKSFVLYGPLNAVRGTYLFRGKLFKITQCEVNFIGQENINPPLNITGETKVADVKIIIHLTGSFERINMVLDSEPSMDQVDIISYLVFGRPQNSLSEGESFQAEEAALSFTGQIAADKLRKLLGDKLSIDYINISAGSGDIRQGSFSMGKYVTPKVFVIFRESFSQDGPRQVEVDYEINQHFNIETSIDDEKTSAVDLIWKHDF